MAWPKKELKYNINYDTLYDLYIIKNYTINECANYLNVSATVIKNRLKLFSLKKDRTIVNKIRYQHILDTMLKRYGRTDVGQFGTAEHEKAMLEKYGTTNTQLVDEIKLKAQHSLLEKYGAAYYVQTAEFKQKSQNTCLTKYGTKYAMQNDDIKAKYKLSCLSKYGVENCMQNSEIISKAAKKYKYDGITFDSSWELALWIYAKDHGIQIERTPIRLEYYYNNKLHYYFPDFIFDGQLIEIKGDHFLDEHNNPKAVFKQGNKDQLIAKFNCAYKNNVKFLKYSDIKFALDYVKTNYGNNYLSSFKNL